MKVAMLASTGENCGIAAYTRALIAELKADVEVLFEPIEVGKQPVGHYEAQAERLNMADVVHIQHEHSFWGGILPGRSAYWNLRYLIQKPVVITAHTTYTLAELLRLKQERRPLHRMAKMAILMRRGYRDSVETAPFVTGRCIVHTEAARQQLIARGAIPEHVHAIPAGVPSPLPATTGGAEFKRQFGLEDKKIVSLFGFVAPNKGYELTLQILPKLPDEVVFVIAGGPRTEDMKPYADSVAHAVRQAGLADRAHITGYLTDEMVAEAMAASDVVVTPHTQATGSYSVMVPLSYGKPVLASDLDVFREIKERGDCIELFKSLDGGDYLKKLTWLLSDENERERLSRAALDYSKRHSWREIARKTVSVYEAAINDAKLFVHASMAA